VFDGPSGGDPVKWQAAFGVALVGMLPSALGAEAGGPVASGVALAVAPEYPAVAHQASIAGTVTIRVSVGQRGTVTHASVVEGHKLLSEAALAAARLWEFNPPSGDTSEPELVFVYKLLPENACFQKTLPRFIPPSRVEVAVRKVVPTCLDCGPSKPIVFEKCK
jgi:TonB family protein